AWAQDGAVAGSLNESWPMGQVKPLRSEPQCKCCGRAGRYELLRKARRSVELSALIVAQRFLFAPVAVSSSTRRCLRGRRRKPRRGEGAPTRVRLGGHATRRSAVTSVGPTARAGATQGSSSSRVSARWREEGLGETRLAIARAAGPPISASGAGGGQPGGRRTRASLASRGR